MLFTVPSVLHFTGAAKAATPTTITNRTYKWDWDAMRTGRLELKKIWLRTRSLLKFQVAFLYWLIPNLYINLDGSDSRWHVQRFCITESSHQQWNSCTRSQVKCRMMNVNVGKSLMNNCLIENGVFLQA